MIDLRGAHLTDALHYLPGTYMIYLALTAIT